MSYRTRISLFLLFVLAFLIGGTGVLLYSYGWRIDPDTKTIQKIGAIYIKTNVRGATITIGEKTYKDASGLLQSGTLISNLLPKTYQVAITKNGYLPYKKTLTVIPSQVAELLNVQLVSETPEWTQPIPAKGTRIIDITQSADKIITKDVATGIYYLSDKTNASSTLNLTAAITNAQKGIKIKRIAFVPFKTTQFIVEHANGFSLFDSEKRTMETLMKGPIEAWSMQNSTILAAQTIRLRPPEIISINLVFKSKTAMVDLNAQLATSTRIAMIGAVGNGSIAFIDASQTLHFFNSKTKEVQQIAQSVDTFALSPDEKKLAITHADGTLNILFLQQFDSDIRKKTGDIISVALPQHIRMQNAMWHADSYHLFIEHDDAISVTELDDRKPLNIFPIWKSAADYNYNIQTNTMFGIDTQTLHTIRLEK